jgi:chorismate-pyruvate lyase
VVATDGSMTRRLRLASASNADVRSRQAWHEASIRKAALAPFLLLLKSV